MRLFISIILAVYANASFALSVGEATLKSYLGDPLIVKLNVNDVEKSPDSSCFTVTDTNDTPAFKRASTSLTPHKDGFQLTITTQSIITEPILNLRVSYHCEPHLSRDYVLLLDPSETPNIANKQLEDSTDKSNSGTFNTNANNNAANDAATQAASSKSAKAKKRVSKKRKATLADGTGGGSIDANSADDKITAAYTGKQQSVKQPTASVANSDKNKAASSIKPSEKSKPYLSISGGNLVPSPSDGQVGSGLKLEREIDFNRASATAPVPVESTEMMDEVTVMTNRLMHLEKQMLTLQAQNTQLKNEVTLAKQALEDKNAGWLKYLLVAAGVVALLAALEWLRRLWVARRSIKKELTWLGTDSLLDAEDFDGLENEPSFAATIPPAMERNHTKGQKTSLLDDQLYDDGRIEPTKTSTLSFTEHVAEEHDSIIDNADVFIEHERPLLAIQLLQNHLQDFPTESPKIWLKLLSLIATQGSAEEYEAAATEANKHYNIRVPSYAEANNPDLSSIEDFSNIAARLEGVWGSPFAVKFLNDLIYDQYAQPAEGLSPHNFEELFFLKKIAELLSTGVSTSQRTLYRTAAEKLDSESNIPASASLDSLAFNQAAFGSDLPSDGTAPTASTEANNTSAISADDTPVVSAPDIDASVKLNKLSKEEAHTQFENSAFQKVPSYDVDMLADFDYHTDFETPIWRNTADSAAPSLQPTLENNDTTGKVSDDFHFPLDVYPEKTTQPDSTTPEESATQENNSGIETDDEAAPNKDKDANIIEWDVPSWTLK